MAPTGVAVQQESSAAEATDDGAGVATGWLDPRISFSVDFVERDQGVPVESAVLDLKEGCSPDFEFFAKERKLQKDAEAVDYSAEFEFCMCTPGRDPLSGGSADELFYQGKLLPLLIPPRLGMLEYMAHDAEPVRFAQASTSSSQLNSQNRSPSSSPYATPTLSPGDSGHLSATASAAAIFPDSLLVDALTGSPLSPGSRPTPTPAAPFGPVLPTCYTAAPESPPSRVASCLPSTPFRHSKSFKWKGLFGSFLKIKSQDEGKDHEEVVLETAAGDGRQLERTESRRRSLSRRLSSSLRRVMAGLDVTEQTTGSSELTSSTDFDFLSVGKADDDVPPVVESTSSQAETCSATLLDDGCASNGPAIPLPTNNGLSDPASGSTSLRTCSSGSAAQSLDGLIPFDDSSDISGELIGDVKDTYRPARRAKHSRWIVLSCGLRGPPRFRGSQGKRLAIAGLRNAGGSSPSKLAVKVGDVDCTAAPGSAKIVLKNLDCASSPTKGCTRVQEQLSLLKQQRDAGYRSPEKLGSYSASVRVMPVLNVPLCNLAPAFRAAQSSSKGRFPGSFRHIFCLRKEKDVPAQESSTDVK